MAKAGTVSKDRRLALQGEVLALLEANNTLSPGARVEIAQRIFRDDVSEYAKVQEAVSEAVDKWHAEDNDYVTFVREVRLDLGVRAGVAGYRPRHIEVRQIQPVSSALLDRVLQAEQRKIPDQRQAWAGAVRSLLGQVARAFDGCFD